MEINNNSTTTGTNATRNDSSRYYCISNGLSDAVDSASLADENVPLASGADIEDIEAFLNDKYYNMIIGNMKSQILQELKDMLNVKQGDQKRLSENLEKEINFLRNDSRSKNKIIELIIKNVANFASSSSSNKKSSSNTISSHYDHVNIENAFCNRTTTKQTTPCGNHNLPTHFSERREMYSSKVDVSSTEKDESCGEDVVDVPNTDILNEMEVCRMRKALGDSAKRFMESMSTVDEMKNYIVNMAVDIKMKENDVMIPGIVPLNNLLSDTRKVSVVLVCLFVDLCKI